MKTLKFTAVGLSLILVATFYSCQTEELNSSEVALDLPSIPFNYFVGNNDNLPTLGRVLFYDPRLSVNNSVSCSSCHKQALAFADRADFSLGFENKLTGRNSMPIQNIVADIFFGGIDSLGFGNKPDNGIIRPLPVGGINEPGTGVIFDPGFFPSFQPTALFWDGRQNSLEKMVMEPIQNHIEMGTNDLITLAGNLAKIPEYQSLFAKAFADGQVTPEHIAKALSAFLVSIRSNQSKFDLSLVGQAQLSGLEQQGKELFFDKYDCNSCHQLQAPFNGYQLAGPGEFGGFADIGLDDKPSDGGVFRVSGNEQDLGKFKIPSLRNVALTAPYMHDGRFESLEEVLDHYSTGISDSENLDERLKASDGSAVRFDIPVSEKRAIIAFLGSMTDFKMIADPKFSNPFRAK
jgi:cytochrome c peroxidase